MKSCKKVKRRSLVYKPSLETKNLPIDVRRKLCKSSRYVDKVIYDLSVNPIPLTRKVKKNRASEVLTTSIKNEENRNENEKGKCYNSECVIKKSENKSTMPDFNIDTGNEKHFNSQGTMPDFNIDCDEASEPSR